MLGPTAMLIVGMLMADLKLEDLKGYRRIWKPVLFRLVVLPLVLIFLARVLHLSSLNPQGETLVLVACDLSGRDYLGWSVDLPAQRVGDFDTELGKEFFLAFVRTGALTLHLQQLAGKNSHHIIEGAFKSVARSLRQAVAIDPRFPGAVPSTKGVL